MPRRARTGDGSLRKRGGGWQARVMIGGKAYARTFHTEKRTDANKLMRQWITELERERPEPVAERATVGQILSLYCLDCRRRKLRSLAQVESRIARLIPKDDELPRHPIVSVEAQRLTRGDVDELAADLADGFNARKPSAAATVNRFLQLVRAALHWAQKQDPPIPCRIPHFELAREDNVRGGFLLASDYQRVLGSIEQPWLKLLFSIAFHTGARAGSILATQWEQVDWGAMVVRPPATQAHNKSIGMWPIYGDMERLLRAAKRYHADRWPAAPWIIHRDGRRLHGHDDYRFAWDTAVKLAGLPHLHLHDLRRTAARNMLAAGVDPVNICKVIGWKGRAMLDRYGILDEQAAARAGSQTAAYLDKDLDRPNPKPDVTC